MNDLTKNIMVVWDRDGTLNVNNKCDLPDGAPGPYYVLKNSDITWRTGAREAITLLTTAGVMSSVVTKQNCIRKGLITLGGALGINRRMGTQVNAAGGTVQRWKIVQGEKGSQIQQEKLAAIKTIASQYHCDLQDCFGVGDTADDIAAYNLAGMTSIYVLTERGEQNCEAADYLVASPMAAATTILKVLEKRGEGGSAP